MSLNASVQSFLSNDLLGCSFSIQGLFNKIPLLFLQIQGVFKEKVIFKEFSRTEEFFQEYSRPERTMLLFDFVKRNYYIIGANPLAA